LALQLPQSLAAERGMWELAGGLTSSPYSERTAELDRFRAAPPRQPANETANESATPS